MQTRLSLHINRGFAGFHSCLQAHVIGNVTHFLQLRFKIIHIINFVICFVCFCLETSVFLILFLI